MDWAVVSTINIGRQAWLPSPDGTTSSSWYTSIVASAVGVWDSVGKTAKFLPAGWPSFKLVTGQKYHKIKHLSLISSYKLECCVKYIYLLYQSNISYSSYKLECCVKCIYYISQIGSRGHDVVLINGGVEQMGSWPSRPNVNRWIRC